VKKALPKKIPMCSVMFVDGRGGYYLQAYHNGEFGVGLVVERASRGEKPTRSWSLDSAPGKTFKTYEELRSSVVSPLPTGKKKSPHATPTHTGGARPSGRNRPRKLPKAGGPASPSRGSNGDSKGLRKNISGIGIDDGGYNEDGI
jgi:hypothetical protein